MHTFPGQKFTFWNYSHYYLSCKIIQAYETTVTFYALGRGELYIGEFASQAAYPITNLLSVGTESADRRIICRLACWIRGWLIVCTHGMRASSLAPACICNVWARDRPKWLRSFSNIQYVEVTATNVGGLWHFTEGSLCYNNISMHLYYARAFLYIEGHRDELL